MCVSRMREPVGLRPDAEEKHTLNLSFNINLWLAQDSEGAALCEPQVPSAHATPAEGLQVLGLVVAAFGDRNLVDDL